MAKLRGSEKPAASPKVAADFDKIIRDGRERKKNEALAQRIFSKDRRQSAPSKVKPGTGPSLASRVGVKKRSSLGPTKQPSAGNIEGEWTHDLHNTVNGSNSLASRVSVSGPAAQKTKQRTAKLADAIQRSGQQLAQPTNKGLSIRGLAGPFAVMAQNFAPGTTAADIESAMTPVGGEMVSCTIVKTSPMILVEMVFVSKEGGDAVIERFHNQTADGRVIKVYAKPGGYTDNNAAPSRPARQSHTDGNIVDGSNGFYVDLTASNGGASRGQLYSDRLIDTNRRGQGRGRNGR
ncbi:hypothetical protein F5X68DRAFT_275950 [Plectosphaerella plurivora]|uniref:RNA-binding protein n=1 Tax=Plectosphaerella plurivora TaxID=936078 RepID=A0A9P9A8R3_9PEZI|nr:hypothetical protein F5X68DRAFT_275950 [Plectosphaerella plurivora]